MSELVFKDPPPLNKGGHRWAELVPQLKAHPGQWALIGEFDKRATHSGRFALRVQGCKTTYRNIGEDLYELYARWPESTNGNGAS